MNEKPDKEHKGGDNDDRGQIKILVKDDERYPPLLRSIPDPPERLYYMGDISLLRERCVAVVGSRKASGYGRNIATRTGSALGAAGVCVVSGMARGIDSFAHEGALRAGGRTIAVLGTGVDVVYPAANRELRERIIREGLVISEYPPGYPVSKYTFPRRNRIISGLSESVVVIEAGIASGSLITAQLAAEQGRNVYAVPANINNTCAVGSNLLLRDGAMPLVIIDDLLRDMGIAAPAPEESGRKLAGDEKRVYDLLSDGGERTVDQICALLRMSPSTVNGIVTVMEMKGLVWTAMGKIFLAK